MKDIYPYLHESWLVGLVFSLGIGHVAVVVFLKWLRSYMKLEPKLDKGKVPPWLMGVGERLFFTIAVRYDMPGVVVAMIAWLGLKLASNWKRPPEEITQEDRLKDWALSAALAGLLSMTFALLGGLLWEGTIYPAYSAQ